MNYTKPYIILVLLSVLLFLIVLNILINKKQTYEGFQSTQPSLGQNQSQDPDLFEDTHDFVDYSRNSEKLMDMFKSLEDAEQKCEALEHHQLLREEKQEMIDNDRTNRELQEQEKKIHELKEIVKYLTIEKKRREKINNKCLSNKQRKLNENYNIVNNLNKKGHLNKNSIDLDLNISDSKNLKKIVSDLKHLKNDSSKTASNSKKNEKKTGGKETCADRGDEYINIDDIGLDKCYGCDSEKIKNLDNYISKDFE